MDPEQIPLRDLHLPADIGWWPLAPGWWFLAAAAAAGACWLLYRAFLNWRANRARRAALRQLDLIAREFAHDNNLATLARQLSELLRRAVLAYAPRTEVAGLTGESWLQWLDRGLDPPLFADGPGRCIHSLPYRNLETVAGDVDVDALIDAVKRRLQTPLPEAVL